MTKETHYKNAPIVEAVFDVRTISPEDFDCKKFESFHEKIKKEFPIKEISLYYKSSIKIKQKKAPECSLGESGSDGFLFKSADGKKIIQFKTGGFTFSKLKPYDNWENFRDEAKKYLKEYYNIVQPIKITRVSLRYINRLDIPLSVKNFKDYLKTIPVIAPDVPQDLTDFFMRLVIPEATKTSNIAIITETIDKTSKLTGNILPLIFDIDVLRKVNLKPDNPEIDKIFETLRDYKNNIFNNSVTEKMKKLIS